MLPDSKIQFNGVIYDIYVQEKEKVAEEQTKNLEKKRKEVENIKIQHINVISITKY